MRKYDRVESDDSCQTTTVIPKCPSKVTERAARRGRLRGKKAKERNFGKAGTSAEMEDL